MLCLKNTARKASMVLYHAHVGHHIDHKKAVEAQMDPLFESVENLREDIAKLREEQIFQVEKEAVHRATNESTNKRVIVFAVLEAAGLVGMSMFQVFFVRRLFDRKDMRSV